MPVEKIGGDYLGPDDVNDGDVLIITQKPVLVETQWSISPGSEEKKKRYRIQVRLKDGSLKLLGLNKTSSNALLDVFGPNEDDWLNKEIICEKRFQKVRGEDRHVLYFKAQDTTIQQQQPKKGDKLTLSQAQEMTKGWPADMATSFIDHLRTTGRLEGGPR